jgi:hypothetical protein
VNRPLKQQTAAQLIDTQHGTEATMTRTATTPLHLLLAWGFVGIPLAWGIVETLINALNLFQ